MKICTIKPQKSDHHVTRLFSFRFHLHYYLFSSFLLSIISFPYPCWWERKTTNNKIVWIDWSGNLSAGPSSIIIIFHQPCLLQGMSINLDILLKLWFFSLQFWLNSFLSFYNKGRNSKVNRNKKKNNLLNFSDKSSIKFQQVVRETRNIFHFR